MIAFASPDPREYLLSDFVEELAHNPPPGQRPPAIATTRNRHFAVKHLERYLGRPATVADLTDENLLGGMRSLQLLGRCAETANTLRKHLLRLGRLAAARGWLSYPPSVEQPADARQNHSRDCPWSVAELNRMLASARSMPDDVAGLPAKHWWPALLLTLLDTAETVSHALVLPPDAYDRRRGQLAIGLGVYLLHPYTVEALEKLAAVDPPPVRLFPWHLDRGRPPFHMLYRSYRWLLYRAGLSHVRANLFDRLRTTGIATPTVIDALDLSLEFTPRPGKLELPRARDIRRAERIAAGEIQSNRGLAMETKADQRRAEHAAAVAAKRPPDVYLIAAADPTRSLLRFFNEVYRPRRLVNGSPSTINHYRRTITQFSMMMACEATVDHLTEDLVSQFVSWIAARKSPATANTKRAEMLALAKLAWKKRLIDDQIRDVEKVRVPKRTPRAWTIEEFSTLLKIAAAETGRIGDMDAGTFWPLLLLIIYDTGLRVSAALALKSADLSPPYVLARAETQKQRADQLLALHPETLELLLSTNPQLRDRLLPSSLSLHRLHDHLRRLLKAAGLPSGRRDLFHKIRRTSATYLCRAAGKAAATEHLGHSDGSVTERYLDPALLERVQAADVLPRPTWR